MALPVDVRDLVKFGRQLTRDRDEPLTLAVLVELDAPDELVDAVEKAMAPRTSQASVSVDVIEGVGPMPGNGTDAALVLAGSAGDDLGALASAALRRRLPVAVLAVTDDADSFARHVGHPLEDVVAGEDAEALVADGLAVWLADRVLHKRIALGANFEFARTAVAYEVVKATAWQNALVGTIGILPGTDMPIMTANQVKMLLQLAVVYGQRLGVDRLRELAAVVGGGLVFRAVARQALTLLPGFGWIIKGSVAFSGTLAMGRAAITYFEEGADVREIARKLFPVKEHEGSPADEDDESQLSISLPDEVESA